MAISYFTVPIGFMAIILSGFSVAGEVTREGAVELMEECQRQRQLNIEPLREQAIENCVNNQRRDREICERHNRNFGERTAGGTQPGMFWGLPECEQAVAAERHFRMNPRSQAFNLP